METQLSDRRKQLLEFVSDYHKEQKRKYTGEPYLNHLIAVGEMAECFIEYGFEIGLCHDIFEDTDCLKGELFHAMVRFGYNYGESNHISDCALELTDIYTTEKFPMVNRAKRKELEALRLHTISNDAQSVKYCDLIDNTSSIVEHDKWFAVKYIAEKEIILSGMVNGNNTLYLACLASLDSAKQKLNL